MQTIHKHGRRIQIKQTTFVIILTTLTVSLLFILNTLSYEIQIHNLQTQLKQYTTKSIPVCYKEKPQIYLAENTWIMHIHPTGSMKPTIDETTPIIVQTKQNYTIGDVIIYNNTQGQSIIHRITNITNNTITTQGDNPTTNPLPDEPFPNTRILAKATYKLVPLHKDNQ